MPPAAHANQLKDTLASCARGVGSTDDLAQARTDVASCMTDRAAHMGVGIAVDRLNAAGKERIGPGFAFSSRLDYSLKSGGKVLGDIDMVLPLGDSETRADPSPDRALFLQNGITRWTGASGEERHDARFGAAHRFAMDGDRGGVFGVSALLQENQEYRHRRLVAGMDYAGAWGSGSLSLYEPLTDWRPGRSGYEEKALAGLDLAMNLDLTTTLGLRATLGRWEQAANPDEVRAQASLGVDWRPHDYLSFGANMRGIGSDDGSSASWRARAEIPLGGGARNKPRWHGFGMVAGGRTHGASIWRGLTHATRIEYAERRVQTKPAERTVGGVAVRFLQAEAESGTDIRVEVSLANPAETDMPLTLHLQPGEGEGMPAEPGVDFYDEPVPVTIRAGETSAVAVIRLLTNLRQAGTRSLGVTVQES